MPEFTLHPKLAEDCKFVCDLPVSRVFVMDNNNFPWLILVPRIADVSELFDLEDASNFLNEINNTAHKLKEFTNADKINIAMLGNQVPQLHCHIIARFKNDSAWPNPVWGTAASKYDESEINTLIKRLISSLS